MHMRYTEGVKKVQVQSATNAEGNWALLFHTQLFYTQNVLHYAPAFHFFFGPILRSAVQRSEPFGLYIFDVKKKK